MMFTFHGPRFSSLVAYASLPSVVFGALSPATIPLRSYFNGTELQWFGTVQVGIPPQNFSVVFDTGSDQFEIPGRNCTTDCPNKAIFDDTKSSSFLSTDPGDGTFFQFSTCTGVAPVSDSLPCELTMWQGSDVVSVGGLSAPNTTFFTIANQSRNFDEEPFDGILGLASSTGSFFQGLIDQGLPPLFGLYLAPNKTGEGSLTLGGVDSSKFTGSIIESALDPQAGPITWSLLSAGQGLTVNGQAIPASLVKSDMPSVIFDSGTSNLVFSRNITEALYALISPSITRFDAEPGTYGIPCSQLSSIPSNLTIDFTFSSTPNNEPFNLTLPSSELSVGPFSQNSSVCQMAINSWDDIVLPPIIGGSVLKGYYTVWNNGNKTLGFAQLAEGLGSGDSGSSSPSPSPGGSPSSSSSTKSNSSDASSLVNNAAYGVLSAVLSVVFIMLY